MTETTNFGLKKPEETDFYSVDTQNDNMDAIDSVLQEFKDGTQPVGDSAKLGGKGAETWQGEIEDIKTVTKKQLTAKGWYRIATGKDVSSSSVISIRNWHGAGGGEDITLLYQCTIASSNYNNAKISTLGSTSSNNNVIFTDVRVVKTADEAGVDVYYNRDGVNTCFFGLLNLCSDGAWRICEPTLVETEPTESDIVIQYSIPKDAQVALTTDLANYLPLSAKPTGTYTGNGSATERIIETNGTGSAVVVTNSSNFDTVVLYSSGYMGSKSNAFISENNAFINPDNYCRITLRTANEVLNALGVTYRWRVI